MQNVELDFADHVLFDGALPKYNVLVPDNGWSRDLLFAIFLFGEKWLWFIIWQIWQLLVDIKGAFQRWRYFNDIYIFPL